MYNINTKLPKRIELEPEEIYIMISRLSDCVLITLDKPVKAIVDKEKLQQKISQIADHGMIYLSSNSKVYHSQQGSHYSGVRSHLAQKIVEQEDSFMPFGSMVFFNIKDRTVRENIAEIAVRWDPTHDSASYAKIQDEKKQSGSTPFKLPTPFVNYMDRNEDEGTPEQIARLELYRAFRAYERNCLNLPLSKEKGVSCGNFISYVIKVAIIKKFFPEELPIEIKEKIAEIEGTKTKKLSTIKPAQFEEFEQIVLKHLLDNQNTSEILPFLKELSRKVKHESVNTFCEDAFENPDFYDFGGYVFVREINQKPELWGMSHVDYLRFIAEYPGESALIMDEQLTRLGIKAAEKVCFPPLATDRGKLFEAPVETKIIPKELQNNVNDQSEDKAVDTAQPKTTPRMGLANKNAEH